MTTTITITVTNQTGLDAALTTHRNDPDAVILINSPAGTWLTINDSGSASVWAFGSASVSASGSASVRAFDSASVWAHDSASVRASRFVAVTGSTRAPSRVSSAAKAAAAS